MNIFFLQVLVKVHCAGISSDDTYIRGDSNSDRSLPFVAGVDAAGVVEAVGAGVQEFKACVQCFRVKNKSKLYSNILLHFCSNTAAQLPFFI